MKLTGIVFDCEDSAMLAGFWSVALGFDAHRDGDFAWLEVPEGHTGLAFQRVPEPKQSKNRLHVDLAPSGTSQADALARLLDAGAKRITVGEPSSATWIVLADPEGNEFCLLAPDE